MRFGFVRAEAERPGLAAGFDLDGRVSTADVTFEARLAFVNP